MGRSVLYFVWVEKVNGAGVEARESWQASRKRRGRM